MTHDNKLVVVFLFLYWEGKTPSQAKIEKLRGDITIAVQNVIGGSVERVEDAMYADIAKVFENQMLAVKEILRREDVFSGTTIEEDVATFYNLGISSLYFGQNNPAQIAKHLTSFIGAKRAATVSGSNPSPGSRIDYGVMSFHHVEGREGVFFCLDADKEKAGLVQKINEYKGECPAELTTAVTMFRSKQPLIHGKCLVMALAVQSRFLRAAPASGVPDIWEVSSASFLRTKSRKSRAKYEEMLQAASGMLHPISDVQKRTRHPGHVVMFVYPQGAPEGGIQFLNDITALLKLQISQLFAETFSNGMVTYNVYVEAAKGHEVADEADMARKILSLQRRMTTLAVLPRAALKNNTDAFGPRAKLYLGCAQVFTYHFMPHSSEDFRALRAHLVENNAEIALDRLDRMGKVMLQDTVTCNRFNQAVQTHPELAWAIYDDFMKTRTPAAGLPQRTLPPLNEELRRRVKADVTDPVDQEIFNACLLFNSAIYKTNFFSREKAATSFRLCPSLFISSEVYPEVPHAIFLIVGASFEGFHVRFRDIARGGIRMIRSPNQAYFKNQQSLFEENYNLAYTQQLKNKDIPEGGSKGTILLNPDANSQSKPDDAYKAYMDALLDLILPNDQVVNLLGGEEILFFGPDEGTAGDVVVWAAQHARKRGYKFWKAITTGKPASMGGIPHDRYGMTTRSVHQQVLGVLRAHDLNEEDVTKFQTGGPDGDLGSNEIKISKDKTIAIVDGSGVICDPSGLNRAEITRLALARQMVSHFDLSKLSPQGYRVLIEEKDVVLPTGETIESGLLFRNEYHLRQELTGDLFVPCGGRPNAVNINNVDRMFCADGVTPRFKYVCEGANLFFTRDARRRLEDAGVVLIKDATCNKGGVTSSSLEVLASLACTEGEHNDLMCVPADGVAPEFYERYVVEVQEKIEENARLEFEALWREKSTGKHKYLVTVTDLLSKKINSLNDTLQGSPTLAKNPKLQKMILGKALPKLLIEKIGLDAILERVPHSYLLAICGCYFASQYVYKYGLNGSEVQVLDFIQEFQEEA